MRLIQPHAGSGKGFYFVPENGEEVLIGFEGGNAERPYVMGTNYNGSESSGYNTSGNDQKVIQTRSGCKILINDADGSILTQDKAGSKVFQDGNGNINMDASNDITINAGGNISMTAGKNISTAATLDISDTAGVNKSTTVGALFNTIVSGDSRTNVNGELHELVQGNRNSTSKKAISIHEDYQMNIAKDKKIHSEGDLHVNSGEKTNIH